MTFILPLALDPLETLFFFSLSEHILPLLNFLQQQFRLSSGIKSLNNGVVQFLRWAWRSPQSANRSCKGKGDPVSFCKEALYGQRPLKIHSRYPNGHQHADNLVTPPQYHRSCPYTTWPRRFFWAGQQPNHKNSLY